jgi:hypothetical protein
MTYSSMLKFIQILKEIMKLQIDKKKANKRQAHKLTKKNRVKVGINQV